jgi:DNA modification methylase
VRENSVQLLFTDPPYNKDSISLYSDLAAFASRVLVPGGLLFAYAGTVALPQALDAVRPHLDYLTTFALYHATWGTTTLHRVKVMSAWKPLLMLGKPPVRPWWNPRPDRVGRPGGREKDYHPHQQALAEVEEIVGHFSRPGSLVVDPFTGSGTVGVACRKLARKFIGFEVHPATARRAAGRIRLAPSGS